MEIARNDTSASIRGNAVFWGLRDKVGRKEYSEKVIELLKEIVMNDPDNGVREKAFMALRTSDMGIPALIDIAKNSKEIDIRKKAIFWLGQSKDAPAREALIEIIMGADK